MLLLQIAGGEVLGLASVQDHLAEPPAGDRCRPCWCPEAEQEGGERFPGHAEKHLSSTRGRIPAGWTRRGARMDSG